MARKVALPLTQRFADSLAIPTIEAIRNKLGGRSSTDGRAGSIVRLPSSGRIGVVLHASGDSVDVYLADGIVKRTVAAEIAPTVGGSGTELDAIAADAQVFRRLEEGQRVLFQAPRAAGPTEGELVEKCRYGALVRRDDGVVMGIGFRKLWPIDAPSA